MPMAMIGIRLSIVTGAAANVPAAEKNDAIDDMAKLIFFLLFFFFLTSIQTKSKYQPVVVVVGRLKFLAYNFVNPAGLV